MAKEIRVDIKENRILALDSTLLNNGTDFNLLNAKTNDLRSLYNALKSYVGVMKLEVDLQ